MNKEQGASSQSPRARGKRWVRTHVSAKPDPIILRAVEQTVERQGGAYKPGGFWYEVDGDWRRWCEGESWGLDTLRHLWSVDLADCNILPIDTLAKLDAFHARYATVYLYSGSHPSIDWRAVAADYDGVEIAPYQWSRRLALDFMWYYGWDCASGVIWRPRNVRVTYLRALAPVANPSSAEPAMAQG